MTDPATQPHADAPYEPPVGRIRPRMRLPTGWLLWLVFAAALAVSFKIYFESPDFSSIPGMGEVLESHAAAAEVARVQDVRVSVGQRVRIGQTMVVFDPAPLDLELVQARDELRKAEAQLAATTLALRRDYLSEQRQFEKSIDVTDMGRIAAAVEAEVDRAEAASLKLRVRWWEGLVAQKLVSEQALIDLKAQLAGVESRIKAREAAIAAWQERLARVEKRWKDWRLAIPSADADPEQRDLAPLRADVAVARAALARVEARRQHMVVRSAVDGVVSRVLMQPGDVATPGQTVVVLRPPSVRRVIAYALDTVARRLRVGASVEVQRRDGTGRMLKGHVEGFGGVAAIPLQLQSVPVRAPLAAEEIVIVLEEGSLLPGEPVDVAFLSGVLSYPVDQPSEAAPPDPTAKAAPAAEPTPATPSQAPAADPSAATATAPAPGPGSEATPAAAPATAETAAEALDVPEPLRQLSRLEPSGLLWLPERQKYLVVSDDTGHPDRHDHAPWLFELDASGH
ncbi:MAG: HlyD family efflux transporter periplasmic adaptor subunit, partial [Deltaproteobacteria bacterium]|nr:HlyD family efflux transporter periplasmic adaptor subunit [Deltaproteobacteria bacterium]